MQNDQSNRSIWSWVISLLLAATLLWMLFTGKGPTESCCTTATPVAEVIPVEPALAVTEAFSFSANADGFNSNGDSSEVRWIYNTSSLTTILGGDLIVEGDDSNVILSGNVASEEIKAQTGLDVQEFFGPDVTIDNQLVHVIEEVINLEQPPAIQPELAKLYFDTASSVLPANNADIIAPIVFWLNNHPEAMAIISGYHDITGDPARNELLSKKRAQSAFSALLVAGVEESRIQIRKPTSTEGDGDLAGARRVEVTIE